MYPFILKLAEIFKTKKRILEELKNSRSNVKALIEGNEVSFYDEEGQKIILEHKPFFLSLFHEDTGLLPLSKSLMKANDELAHYQDDEDKVSIRDKFGIDMSKNLAHCGSDVHRAYLDMMRYVEKEQYFLAKGFIPVLEEMSKREDYNKAWTENLAHFGNFLVILYMDLELFYNLMYLLKERGFLGETVEARDKNRAVAKDNFIRHIKNGEFAYARYLVNHLRRKEWFTKEEIEVLSNLVFFIEQQDGYQLAQIINSENFKKIFNEEERRFFENLALQLTKIQILILTPLNSTRIDDSTAPIEIISVYHESGKDFLEIGKSEDCDIKIVDSTVEDPIQALIAFIRDANRFAIRWSKKSTFIVWNQYYPQGNKVTEKNSEFLIDGERIDINGYLFEVSVKPIEGTIVPKEEYNNQFLNLVLRITSKVERAFLTPEDVFMIIPILKALEDNSDNLGLPPEMKREIADAIGDANETLEEIKEVEPEAKKTIRKKPKLRLKARLRLARMKYKRSRRQVLERSKKVQSDSSALINSVIGWMANRLAKERQEIGALIQTLSSQAEQLRATSTKIVIESIEQEITRGRQLLDQIDDGRRTLSSIRQRAGTQITKSTIEFVASVLESTRSYKKILQRRLEDLKAIQIPVSLQPVRIGLRKVWVPTINFAAKSRRDLVKRLSDWLIRFGTRTKLLSRTALLTAMLAPTLIGIFPERAGGGYIRIKTDEEIAREILPEASNFEIIEMMNATGFINNLTSILDKNKSGEIKYEELPDYIKELISDGVLDIAYFAGVEMSHAIYKSELKPLTLAGRRIVLRIRYITTREDAIKAFEEAEVIHVNSHSRYGLGWALIGEGVGAMKNPLRIQTHPIKIPKNELHGYKGHILKDYGDGYVLVQASDEDLKKIKPRKGYQLITMESCSSGEHFLEVIKRLRQGLPTTVIYTTQPPWISSGRYIFEGLLTGLFEGKSIEEVEETLEEIERKYGQDPTVKNYYESVVLNTKPGSLESTQYDRFNAMLNSFTLFYDIERP